MASPANLREMLRTTRLDGGILLLTAALVIFIDLIWGIAIGALLYFCLNKFNSRKLKRK
jgi:MFS superfamily sulfate permease-like transporter